MDGKTAEWFGNQNFFLWSDFEKSLLERFGLDPFKMLAALNKREQGADEPVRDFADSLRTLGGYSSNKHIKALLLHFFMENTWDDVRQFVLARRPSTFDTAVAEGEVYEDQVFNRNKIKSITFNLPDPPNFKENKGNKEQNAS